METNEFQTFLDSLLWADGKTWEEFCRWAGDYFSGQYESNYDASVLAQMARIKLWEIWQTTDMDLASRDFTLFSTRSVYNLLRDRLNREVPDKMEGAVQMWRPCLGLVVRIHWEENWDVQAASDVLEDLIFSDSVKRMRSLLDEDSMRLFDYLFEGDPEVDEAVWIVAEKKGQKRVRSGRYGREVMAEALGWGIRRYRRAMRQIEIAAMEVFAA